MMWKTMGLLSLVLGGVSLGYGADGGVPTDDYRSWTRLTPEAYQVSFALAVQCAPVTDVQLERERKKHGPHTDRWIVVYANPVAAAALRDKIVREFPEGAAFAKEKLLAPGDTGGRVAFMIASPAFTKSGGWSSHRPWDRSTRPEVASLICAGGQRDMLPGAMAANPRY
jgi:hypothetical protein